MDANTKGYFNLTKIPRYATSNQSLNSKTSSSIKMNWSSDNTIDHIWYSTNNGSNWTDAGSVNATSGSYTISGLSANTTYNIKTRVRRKDSQLTTDSTVLAVTTYATTVPTISVSSKTVNSVTVTSGCNVAVSSTQYRIKTSNGSYGSYQNSATFSGLSPNTAYVIEVKKVGQASGETGTATTSVTTYDIAKLSSVPNANIGASQTITWTNPSGATTTLKLCKTDNTQVIDYGTVTGTSKTVTPTANTIYALTPNSNTITLKYRLTTTANGTSYTDDKTCVFTVTNSNPTFSDFTYADINGTTTALTGSNQILVKGYSNVRATISTSNKAVANNSATMSSYKMIIGSKTATANYSSNSDVTLTINAVDTNVIDLYAIDSRANSTSVRKQNLTIKNYSNVAISSVTATRTNNVGTEVTLSFDCTFWNSSFGSVQNAIQVCKYEYKKTSASSWTTGETTLTYTINNNRITGSVVIKGDLGATGFDATSTFDIRFTLTDKLSTATYTVTLGSGNPAIAIYKNKVAIGQKYDTSTGEALQVNGDVKANNFKGKATSAGTADSAITANGLSSTIANNRLPARLQEYRTDATTIDNTVNGFYYANSGGPFEGYHSSNKDYMILAQGYSSAWGFQIATDFRTNNLAVRNKNNGTWGSWKIISGTASSRNVTTASSKTHTNFGTNGGNVPTMDFLSCWNGAYSSGNSSNLTYGHQGVILCKPTTLYSNSTGTTGTVTLSQSAGNFNYIRIFYYKAGVYSAVEVGNGKNADLVLFYTATSTIGQFIHKTAKVNGTSITVVNTASANPRLDTPAWSGNSSSDNTIYIYYVQGWKDT